MAQYVMSMLRVNKTVPPKRQIIKNISLSFFPGAKIGLLGLNGSGKSTVLRIMAGVDKEYEGEVQHLPNIKIGYLAQEPQLDPNNTVKQEVESSLGEVMQAQKKLDEVYAAYAEENADFDALATEQARLENIIAAGGSDAAHQMEIARHRGLSRAAAETEAEQWLRRVALPDPERHLRAYPYQLSGGMRQRALLALALAGGPRLLVADEPTAALDVTVQAQILDLLLALRQEFALAILLITHDLAVVAEAADRVLVMYAGEIVESAPVDALFSRPRHPYTRALLAARPGPPSSGQRRLEALEGSVPEPGKRPRGCAFEPRCEEAFGRCAAARPTLVPSGALSEAACFLLDRPPGEGLR